MSSAAYETDYTDADVEFPSDAARHAIALHTAPVVELASPSDIHAAMMQLDEQALLSEIMGEALDKWFYSFKVSGKLVEGVSAKGAHEFARLRAEQGFPIRFPASGIRYEEAVENGEAGVRVFIVAREVRTHQEAIGMAFYPYHTERHVKDNAGNILKTIKEFDKYAGRKAMSVAERNAILRLTPEQLIVAALKGRAQAIARNEMIVTERARLAVAARPTAPVERVGPDGKVAPKALADPYAPPAPTNNAPTSPTTDVATPACPVCGGEMWDNRQTRKNPRSPDFKCKNGPRSRGGPGCAGVVWPDKAADAATPAADVAPLAPPPDAAVPGELPLEAPGRGATTRTNALREG